MHVVTVTATSLSSSRLWMHRYSSVIKVSRAKQNECDFVKNAITFIRCKDDENYMQSNLSRFMFTRKKEYDGGAP